VSTSAHVKNWTAYYHILSLEDQLYELSKIANLDRKTKSAIEKSLDLISSGSALNKLSEYVKNNQIEALLIPGVNSQ